MFTNINSNINNRPNNNGTINEIENTAPKHPHTSGGLKPSPKQPSIPPAVPTTPVTPLQPMNINSMFNLPQISPMNNNSSFILPHSTSFNFGSHHMQSITPAPMPHMEAISVTPAPSTNKRRTRSDAIKVRYVSTMQ